MRFTVGIVVPLLRSWKLPPLIVAVVAALLVPASVRLFIWKTPAMAPPASVWPVKNCTDAPRVLVGVVPLCQFVPVLHGSDAAVLVLVQT